jgi:diguanylate cyclase (GGDEF)-like protein/PAS domain S-box-containing protein
LTKPEKKVPPQSSEKETKTDPHPDSTVRIKKRTAPDHFTLFERLSIGIYRVREDGTAIEANPNLNRMLGCRSQEEFLGKNFSEWFYSKEEYLSWQQSISDKQTVKPETYTFQKIDGSTIFVRSTACRVANHEGQTIFIEGILEDITSLQHINEISKTLLDHTVQGMAIVQGNKVVVANKALADITGAKIAEITGMTYGDILEKVHADDRQAVLKKMRARQSGLLGSHDYRFRFCRSGEDIIWVEMRSVGITFRGLPAILHYFSDITTRKNADDENTRHAAAIQMTAESIIITDIEGTITEANPSAAKLVDAPQAADLSGKNLVSLFAKEDRDRLARDIREARKNGSILNREFYLLRQNGCTLPVELSISMIEMEKDISFGMIAVFREITIRKRAEMLQKALYRISEAAMSTLSLEELYASVHNIINGLIPAVNFYIAISDPKSEIIHFVYHRDEHDTTRKVRKWGQGLTEYVIKNGEPLLATPEKLVSIRGSGLVRTTGTPSFCWLGVPLKNAENITFGVLVVQTYTPGVIYTDEDKEILSFVSMQIASAIERKRAEKALSENEERFRSLVYNLPVGVFRNRPGIKGKFLMANPVFLNMIGVNRIDDLEMKALSDLFEEIQFFKTYQKVLLAKGSVVDREVRVKRKDGSVIWCLLTSVVVRNPVGDIEYIDNTIEDISQKKRTETLQNALYRISEAVNSTVSLENLYKTIHGIVSELILARNFYIAIFNAEEQTISFPYFIDEIDEPPAESVKFGHGLTEYVLRTGKPLFASPEVFQNLKEAGEVDRVGEPSVDWLGVPLKTADRRTIGALVVQTYTEGSRYSKSDLDILEFVSTNIAIAIERKISQEAMRDSEERYRAISSLTSDFAYSLRVSPDKELTIEWIVGAYERITGFTAEEITARGGWPGVVHPDDREKYLAFQKAVFTSPGSETEVRIVTRNGKVRWIKSHALPVLIEGNNGIARIYGASQDITEQKTTEETLKASEARNRDLVEQISSVLYLEDIGENSATLYISPQCETMLGYPPSAWAEDGQFWTKAIHEEDLAAYLVNEHNSSINGIPFDMEYRFKKPDGTIVWVRDQAMLVEEAGQKPFWRGMIYDITKQKLAEIELQAANEKLKKSISELEKRNRESTLLNEMAELLQSSLTEEEAYEVLTHYSRLFFQDQPGALFLNSPDKNTLTAVAAWGDPPPEMLSFPHQACWALRRGRSHLIDPDHHGPHCNHISAQIDSDNLVSLCVPLIAQGDTLGMLHLEGSPEKPLAHLEQFAITVAEHTAMAMANLRLRDTLRSQSFRDALTGLYNRRFLEEIMEREFSRADRHDRNIGFIILDMDGLKETNDQLGHDAGDLTLQTLADYLKNSIRAEDIACRLGGDEFVLILPDTNKADTLARARRLHESSSQMTAYYNGQPLKPISFSLGVASYPENGADARSVFKAADEALLKAKKEGRDRIEVAA